MAKRSGNKSKKAKRTKSYSTQTHAETPKRKRRDMLNLAGTLAAVALVLGGIGYYAVQSVNADMAEQDLTQINHNRPTIVQVHDENCTTCVALQGQVRKALRAMGDDQPDYFVANLATAEGQFFAGSYNAHYTTLLLFDKGGRLQNTLQGVRQRDELLAVFQRYTQNF